MIKAAIVDTILHLLILVPFFIAATRFEKITTVRPLYFFAAVYLLNNVISYTGSTYYLFENQIYNWIGKIAAIIFLVIAAYVIPGFHHKEFGFTARVVWVRSGTLFLICAIYLVARIGFSIYCCGFSYNAHPETILYQATLPGLQEELLYRGILLGLLNRVFRKPPWIFAKINFGWPVMITSILFGLAHSINMEQDYSFYIRYGSLVRIAFNGFLFGVMTEKTKSILPAVIFHNILNLIK